LAIRFLSSSACPLATVFSALLALRPVIVGAKIAIHVAFFFIQRKLLVDHHVINHE